MTDLRWQPIETAPKDGATPLLAYRRTPTGPRWQVAQFVHWEGGGTDWCSPVSQGFMRTWEPTHWMPLPAPPSQSGEE